MGISQLLSSTTPVPPSVPVSDPSDPSTNGKGAGVSDPSSGAYAKAALEAIKDKALAKNADPLEATQAGVVPSLPGYAPQDIQGHGATPDVLGYAKAPVAAPGPVQTVEPAPVPTATPEAVPPVVPPSAPKAPDMAIPAVPVAPAETGPVVPQVTQPSAQSPQKDGDFGSWLSDLYKKGAPILSTLGGLVNKFGAGYTAASLGQPGQAYGLTNQGQANQVRALDLQQQGLEQNKSLQTQALNNQMTQAQMQHDLGVLSLNQNKALTDAERAEKVREFDNDLAVRKQAYQLQLSQLERGLTTAGQSAAGKYY